MIGTLALCNACVHDKGDGTCTAFPGGIPHEIILQLGDHRQPYRGDRGIRFHLKVGRDAVLESYDEAVGLQALQKSWDPDVKRAVVSKANPYHDEHGRFTTSDHGRGDEEATEEATFADQQERQAQAWRRDGPRAWQDAGGAYLGWHVTTPEAAQAIAERGFQLPSRTVFEEWGRGLYFAPGKDPRYATGLWGWTGHNALVHVRVHLANPLILDMTTGEGRDLATSLLPQGHRRDATTFGDRINEVAREQGYDGLVVRDDSLESGGNQIIAFDPSQVEVVGVKKVLKSNPYHDERGRFSTGPSPMNDLTREVREKSEANMARYQHVQWVATDKLAPYQGNDVGGGSIVPTTLDETIRQNGFENPLVFEYSTVNHNGKVGEGNHRLAAAQRLGLSHVPVRAYRVRGSLSGATQYGGRDPKPVPGVAERMEAAYPHRDRFTQIPPTIDPANIFPPEWIAADANKAWDPSLHPRGQPDNAGQFAPAHQEEHQQAASRDIGESHDGRDFNEGDKVYAYVPKQGDEPSHFGAGAVVSSTQDGVKVHLIGTRSDVTYDTQPGLVGHRSAVEASDPKAHGDAAGSADNGLPEAMAHRYASSVAKGTIRVDERTNQFRFGGGWTPDTPEFKGVQKALTDCDVHSLTVTFGDPEYDLRAMGDGVMAGTKGTGEKVTFVPLTTFRSIWNRFLERQSSSAFMPEARKATAGEYDMQHELGHVLSFRTKGVKEAANEMYHIMLQYPDAVYPGHHLSEYGLSTPLEAIAELHASYMLGSKDDLALRTAKKFGWKR